MNFNVGRRALGDGEPVFIIAENGNNHAGDFSRAMAAVEAAKECGADAITFQHTPIDSYVISEYHSDSRVAYLKECELSEERLRLLRARADELGLAFSINVEDRKRFALALDIGIDFIKVCSGEITNLPMLELYGASGLPVFFSTGSASFDEIEFAWSAMKHRGMKEWVVYHTNTKYPTPIAEADITRMDDLHARFGGVKGYCDHTAEIIPPVCAVARGAKAIEKHLTTSRALKGDDWIVSLEPSEFHAMVKAIRECEASLMSPAHADVRENDETRSFKRKSVVAAGAIPAGTKITMEMLTTKLPATGISPVEYARVVGKTAARNIAEDVAITADMLKEW